MFGIRGSNERVDNNQPFGGQRVGVSVILAEIDGDVQVYEGPADSEILWRPAEVGATLKEGDTIRTGSASKAVIEIDGGSVIRMNAESEIMLSSMQTNSLMVSQIRGEAYHRVAPNSMRTYVVSVNDVSFTAQGTIFNINKQTDQEIGLQVIENDVAVSVIGEEVITAVAAGERLLVMEVESGVSRKKVTMTGEEFDSPWFEYVITAESAQQVKLGVLEDQIPPALEILNPVNGFETTSETVTIRGTTDPTATLRFEDESIDNSQGTFEVTGPLVTGKNEFTVKAYLPTGGKKAVEVNVFRLP